MLRCGYAASSVAVGMSVGCSICLRLSSMRCCNSRHSCLSRVSSSVLPPLAVDNLLQGRQFAFEFGDAPLQLLNHVGQLLKRGFRGENGVGIAQRQSSLPMFNTSFTPPKPVNLESASFSWQVAFLPCWRMRTAVSMARTLSVNALILL